jgi:hypothetical protein
VVLLRRTSIPYTVSSRAPDRLVSTFLPELGVDFFGLILALTRCAFRYWQQSSTVTGQMGSSWFDSANCYGKLLIWRFTAWEMVRHDRRLWESMPIELRHYQLIIPQPRSSKVNPENCHQIIREVAPDEHYTSLLHAILHPHATGARQTVIMPGLAAVQIEVRATSTRCVHRGGLHPVVYSRRMARGEQKKRKGDC